MTVKDIVKKYLEENDFDGLYSPNGFCACRLEDLMPCFREGCVDCEPGYVVYAENFTPEEREYCEECEFIITEQKRS